MENFYDLNDFIAYILRKWKIIIVIVCIGTIGFAGFRFQSLYQDYRASQNQPQETVQATSGSEPMKCWSEISINVGPNYEVVGTTGIARGEEIANAYNAVKNDNEIMTQMHDQFFEQAKVYGDKMRELMSTYGYILDKERNNEYVEYDFRRQFSVSVTQNYVTIGFYSLNEEFSKEVVTAYESLLTAAVEEQYPDFEYTKVAEATRYELPETSAGASPSRNVGGSTSAASTMTMSTVIKQTIKGCVWGVIIGCVAALIIVFLMYMMSRKVLIWAQLQKENIRTYGLFYKKKGSGITKLYRRWIAGLEGNKTAFPNAENLWKVVLTDIRNRFDDDESIAVCGSTDFKLVRNIAEHLNKQCKSERFWAVQSPLTSGADMENGCGKVILVECIGKSLKHDLDKEIEIFDNYNVTVVGIIGVE